ncbi:MAG TPA: hypothetical protein VI432_01520 [Candidatus Paceibacterota bacterium]
MALGLKLFLKGPISKLAFRSSVVAIAVLALRLTPFGFLPTSFFLILFSILYLQPNLNNGRFLIPFSVLLFFIFFMPLGEIRYYELYIAGLSGILFFMLSGVKNVIFINRNFIYRISHGALILLILSFFFKYPPNLYIQFMTFLLIFFLYRELYLMHRLDQKRINLLSAIMALLVSEIIWAIFLIPTSFSGLLFMSAAPIFLVDDILINYLRGERLHNIFIRDFSLFIIFIIFVAGFINFGLPR